MFWWTHIPFQIVFLKTIQNLFGFIANNLDKKKLFWLFDSVNKYFNVENFNQSKAEDYELIREICKT